MGFLDSLKDSVNSAINGKKEQGHGIQHEEAPGSKKSAKKSGLLSGLFGDNSSKKKTNNDTPPLKKNLPQDDDDSLSMFNDSSDDFDYNEIDDEIKGHRSDVLELLNIAEDYPVPSNVLLLGDLDRVRFDVSQPKGYDMHMVEEFYDSVHDSIAWYVDKLQQRNNDIRKMEDMLNKQNTDIHNAKVAEAMSDPDFTIMTGSESTAEQELQEAQVKIMNLEDENRKLQKKIQSMGNGNGDQMDAETQSRYDALQNQLGIVQRENQKLKSQLKRQALEEVAVLDKQQDGYTTADEYGDDDYSMTGQFDADDPSFGQGMPMPGGPSPSMPNPNKGNGIPTPGGMPVQTPGGNNGMSMPGGMPSPSMGGGMPTPGSAMPAPGGVSSPASVNPFNGGNNSGLKPAGPSIKELTNPSFASGRLGENSSKAMTMQSALDADDDYDLDPQVTSGSGRQAQDANFDGGFDDSFSFDYDGEDNVNDSNDSNNRKNTQIPISIDNGDYDEINLLDDDDDDNEIISLDDGLFD